MKKKFFILFILFLASQLFAQDDKDAAKNNKLNYAVYPMAFYTPETQFAFGGGGMLYTRLGLTEHLRISKITFSTYYTSNNQFYLLAEPAIFFPGNAGITSESIFIYSNELSKFYGIGNNTPEIDNPDYKLRTFSIYTELGYKTKLFKNLHLGFIYEFTTNVLLDKGDNPELDNKNLVGIDAGKTSGFGFLLVVDHRNNIFYPTEGGFFKMRMIFAGKSIGGDYTFNKFFFDYRNFFDIGNSNIIAGQFYYEIASGDIPFFQLPALGGPDRMRGYFLGRYRDNIFLTWQIEYRRYIWWNIGATFFFSMGDVAHKNEHFRLPEFKYSYGFGLRYLFDKDEKINVRMDLGFGKNTNGIYFSIEEAF